MRVFISCDMEGATGITHGDQTRPGGHDYERARKWLTRDVNAAVLGAFDGGAQTVRIADGHGNMRNLLLEELDPRAEVVLGTGLERELCQLEGLDSNFGAVLMVACHSRAGTLDGVLAHTWIGSIVREIRIGGEIVGEIGIAAATAADMGVPIAMVAGDSAACREAVELLDGVATAQVKTALGSRVAICLHPDKSFDAIRAAAREGVEKAEDLEPLAVPSPAEIAVKLASPLLAHQAVKSGGMELVEDDTVRIVRKNAREAIAAAWRVCYLSTLEQNAYPNW